MEKDLNIYQRMSLITAEISAVAKNLQVGEGRNQYKAVGEADVLAAVRPIENKYGVYSYPMEREVVESAVLTNVSEYKGQTKETKKQFMRLKVVYRFVNVDNPQEYIDITTYGDGVDTQDKAPGKAMTYADKYALLKAYKIITGDDPDQKMSEEFTDIQKKKPAPKSTEAKSRQPEEELITEKEALTLGAMLTENQTKWVQGKYGDINALTKKQYVEIINTLKARSKDGNKGADQ